MAAALIAPVQIPNTFPIILQSSSTSFLAEAHAFDLAPLLSSKPSFITETLQHPRTVMKISLLRQPTLPLLQQPLKQTIDTTPLTNKSI